jgi:hypothetical protein
MIQDNEIGSFEAFQDSLSTTVIAKLAPRPTRNKKKAIKGRKNEIKPVAKVAESNGEYGDSNDAAELSDFVEVRQCQPSTVANF